MYYMILYDDVIYTRCYPKVLEI